MKNGTFTFGTTPETIIKTAFENENLPNRKYHMDLVGDDAQVVIDAVNQGIDSYLQAIIGSYFNVSGNRMSCEVTVNDLCVLLRRLFEDGSENAWSLRSSILTTLEIEEV